MILDSRLANGRLNPQAFTQLLHVLTSADCCKQSDPHNREVILLISTRATMESKP